MSDLVERLMKLGILGGETYNEAAAEIEHLIAKDKEKSELLDDMHIDRCKLKAEIKQLDQQNTIFSEELAAHLCDSKLYHVTSEEINAAWAYMVKNKEEWEKFSWIVSLQTARCMALVLAFWGIKQCEMCNGTGGVCISTENGDVDGDCGGCARWGSGGWVKDD